MVQLVGRAKGSYINLKLILSKTVVYVSFTSSQEAKSLHASLE